MYVRYFRERGHDTCYNRGALFFSFYLVYLPPPKNQILIVKKKWKLNPGLCQIYRSNNIEKNKVGSTIQWLVLGNSSAEEARQSERFLAKKMLRTPLLSRSARVNETKIPGDECCGIYWVEPAFFAEAPYNGW